MSQSDLSKRFAAVQRDIFECAKRSGRDSNEIKLIAVSKTRTLEEVMALAELGQTSFGENTIQDAMTKVPQFNSAGQEWHFIGHLQSKKAGKIPGYFQWIHSVDSIKLAKKLSTAMQSYAANSVLNCLLQVNVSGEHGKSGIMPSEVCNFLQDVLKLDLPGLRWRGLMTIGVRGDERLTRASFRQLADLREKCGAEFNLEAFDQLSMGMSDDYCIAIEEGATMVRIGTSIFGERNKPESS